MVNKMRQSPTGQVGRGHHQTTSWPPLLLPCMESRRKRGIGPPFSSIHPHLLCSVLLIVNPMSKRRKGKQVVAWQGWTEEPRPTWSGVPGTLGGKAVGSCGPVSGFQWFSGKNPQPGSPQNSSLIKAGRGSWSASRSSWLSLPSPPSCVNMSVALIVHSVCSFPQHRDPSFLGKHQTVFA